MSPWLLATTLSSAWLAGMVMALLPRIRLRVPAEGTDGDNDAAPTKWLLLTLVPMMLVSGPAVDKWGAQEVLFLGALLCALGLATWAVSETPWGVLAAALLLAAATACLLSAVTVLMPFAFFPAHRPEARAAHALNFGFIVFSLATLTSAGAVSKLMKVLGRRSALLLLGLVSLVPGALAALTPKVPSAGPALAWGQFFADPHLWLAGLVVVLYMPLEGSLTTWASSFLKDLRYESRRIPYVLAGFWAVFLAARLVAGLLMQVGYETWLVFFLVLIIAMTFGNLVGAYGPGSGEKGMLVMWACAGPIFPTLMGAVLTATSFRTGGHIAASTFSTLYAFGLAGSLAFQPALSWFAQKHSVRATMRIPMLLALAAAAPSLVLALLT